MKDNTDIICLHCGGKALLYVDGENPVMNLCPYCEDVEQVLDSQLVHYNLNTFTNKNITNQQIEE